MAPWKDWRSKGEDEEELQGNSLFKECDITVGNPWNEYWEPQRAGDRVWELKDVDGYPLWMTKEYKMVMSWDDSGAQEARRLKEAWSKGLLAELPDFSPDKYNDHIDWDVDLNWSNEAAAAWAYLAANKPEKPAKRRRGGGGRSWYRRNDDNYSGHRRMSSQQEDDLRAQHPPAASPSGWSPPRQEEPSRWPDEEDWKPASPPGLRWSLPREEEPAAWPHSSRWSDEDKKPASPPGLRWKPPRYREEALVAQTRWCPPREKYNTQGWSRRPTSNERQPNQQRQRRWNNRNMNESRDACRQPRSQYIWRPKQQQQQQQQQMPW